MNIIAVLKVIQKDFPKHLDEKNVSLYFTIKINDFQIIFPFFFFFLERDTGFEIFILLVLWSEAKRNIAPCFGEKADMYIYSRYLQNSETQTETI